MSASPLALLLVFISGLITSLGPCSLSLLPVTLAYLAGFDNNDQKPWIRSLSFSSGIVTSMVFLGLISGTVGHLYGKIPSVVPVLVATLSIIMGLQLLEVIRIPLRLGPDPESWRRKMPGSLAPLTAGLAFGLTASPCSTPVLAVLLASIAQSRQPITGILLLAFFGAGQVVPLMIGGMAAANLPRLSILLPFGNWVPSISGVILITTGMMNLFAQWS
uniref:Putative c-type cytochrome biogenesis protein CcdA n=1 Tax=Paulinella chromatophora TaxID=39717 RepID=B1X3X3_PAUCH|nr:putative c-type cytochrome biogenesis protein CcdA [Paulinella chromatophora]ACB42642.1 putative c-type cytochrome biogenesis protein CcdA [Paulinella chromatophora]